MKIRYSFKDKLFNDVRDIIHNNKLEVDYNYILNEYLPFQIFVTGKTFYKGVRVEVFPKFDPKIVPNRSFKFNHKWFSDSIRNYLSSRKFDRSSSIVAVSGGVDSSVMALEIKPNMIYSGYYEDPDFDETKHSSLISKKLKVPHLKYLLNEDDFIENMEECLDVIGIPIAGMGSVMEYALAKRVKKDTNFKNFVFGNGGDEIFMGYLFNHHISSICKLSYTEPKYMPNFLPSMKNMITNAIDYLIMISLNRKYHCRNNIELAYFGENLIKEISGIKDLIGKLLYVNINMILPSLLHLNNQMCRSLDVCGLNPLANVNFIMNARSLCSTPIPKEKLRNIDNKLPRIIRNNYVKKGFPIPYQKWSRLNDLMKQHYNSFSERLRYKQENYPGINRYTWGVSQAEMFLRKNGR
uniref:Putative asparagine synthase n=1 Tax=viral metagenome TaxID=1070528 RepID=A0A6M3IZR4_9ZZZZ